MTRRTGTQGGALLSHPPMLSTVAAFPFNHNLFLSPFSSTTCTPKRPRNPETAESNALTFHTFNKRMMNAKTLTR